MFPARIQTNDFYFAVQCATTQTPNPKTGLTSTETQCSSPQKSPWHILQYEFKSTNVKVPMPKFWPGPQWFRLEPRAHGLV